MNNLKAKTIASIIVTIILILTGFFYKQVLNLKFSGSVSDLVVVGDEDQAFVKKIQENSGVNVLVAMVKGDDIFTVDGLAELKKITDAFEKAGVCSSVSSITNLNVPKSRQINTQSSDRKERMGVRYAFEEAAKAYYREKQNLSKQIVFKKGKRPLFPLFKGDDITKATYFIDYHTLWQKMPTNERELKEFLRDIDLPLYWRNFVSPSMKYAAIILNVDEVNDEEAGKIVSVLETIAKENSNKYKVSVVGYMTLKEELKHNIIKDTSYFVKIAFIFVILSYFISFRTIRGFVLPLVTLLISEIWILGVMAMLKQDLNIVLYIVPVFVVAVGSSSSIHVLSQFYTFLRNGHEKIPAVIESLKEVIVAILTASATTAFGFAMLTISNVSALNMFAVLTIAGLGISTFNSLAFIPCMNILLPAPKLGDLKPITIENSPWTKAISWIIKYHKAVLFVFVIIAIIASWGIYQIKPDNDLTKLLNKDSETIKRSDELAENLAGTTILTLAIDGRPGDFIKYENLAKIEALQKELENSIHVDKTTSIADVFILSNFLSKGGREKSKKIPNEQFEINGYIHFIERLTELESLKEGAESIRAMLRSVCSEDYSQALIMIRSNLTSLQLMKEEHKRIISVTQKIMGGNMNVRLVGDLLNMNKAVEKILYGQTKGVLYALATIFVLMLFLFWSVSTAVLTIIPNLFPILFFYGTLGLTDIGLDLSSGLIACVAIGIAVDDTIHFMLQFKKQLHKTYETKDAMILSMNSVGSPIVITSFVLAILFGVMWFSKFPVMVNLGILQSFTMIVCLICNLVLLPGIISSVRFVSLWDVLTKFHSFCPQNTPVFKGMSRFSINLLLSLATFEEFEENEIVISRGDLGDKMYIIVEGNADVLIEDPETGAILKRFELAPNSIFGEVAVIGEHRRGATIEARKKLKVISISKDFFAHATRLYPRACNKFITNTVTILGERLNQYRDQVILEQKEVQSIKENCMNGRSNAIDEVHELQEEIHEMEVKLEECKNKKSQMEDELDLDQIKHLHQTE